MLRSFVIRSFVPIPILWRRIKKKLQKLLTSTQIFKVQFVIQDYKAFYQSREKKVLHPSYGNISKLRRSICPQVNEFLGDGNEFAGTNGLFYFLKKFGLFKKSERQKKCINKCKLYTGVSLDLKEAIGLHLDRALPILDLKLNPGSTYIISITIGLDGRGGEKEYNQVSSASLRTDHALVSKASLMYLNTTLFQFSK